MTRQRVADTPPWGKPVSSIYIVEDEALIAMELEDHLRSFGYRVCGQSARAETALREAPALNPDLILMDLKLAGDLSGIDAARQLHDVCDAAILFLTAYADTAFADEAAKLDGSGFLLKPFHPHVLRANIEMALRRRQMERDLGEANRALARANRQLERQSQALRVLAVGVARLSGKEFYDEIAHQLTRVFEVEVSIVATVKSRKSREPETISAVVDGELTEPVDMVLEGTPCGLVLESGFFVIPSGAADDYPRAPLIQQLSLSGYAGCSLLSARGQVLGYIAIASRKALQAPSAIAPLLKLFAVRVAAELERRQQQLHLQQAQKMEALGAVASGVAHDFNNLLTAILCHVDAASAGVEPTSSSAYSLDLAIEACERASLLARQILSFSRHRSESRRPVDLVGALNEVLRLLRKTLPSTLKLSLDVKEAITRVHADETQMHQLIMNLITNAADAVGDTPGRVEIAVSSVAFSSGNPQQLRPGAYLLLRVSDDGSGMGEDTQERVFEPFFTTKGDGQGTGLGLSVVRNIVETHGGAVEVSSEVGRGTTFSVYLPAAEGDADTEEPSALRAS